MYFRMILYHRTVNKAYNTIQLRIPTFSFAGWYVGLKSDTDHAPGVISMDYAPRPDQVLRPWTTYNGSHDVPDYKIEAFCGGRLQSISTYYRFTKYCVGQILRIYRKSVLACFNFANWSQHGGSA